VCVPEAKRKHVENEGKDHKHEPALHNGAALGEGLESLLGRLLAQLEVHALGRFAGLSQKPFCGGDQDRHHLLRCPFAASKEAQEGHDEVLQPVWRPRAHKNEAHKKGGRLFILQHRRR
jgi:hypothetical protein